jgi:hypothetical protein
LITEVFGIWVLAEGEAKPDLSGKAEQEILQSKLDALKTAQMEKIFRWICTGKRNNPIFDDNEMSAIAQWGNDANMHSY